MSSEPQRSPIPFEPKNRKKQRRKAATKGSNVGKTGREQAEVARRASPSQRTIPEAVSRRMIRRMVFFCGLPTALGISSFILSYFIVTEQWFPLPNAAVVAVSMGFFGMGVLGLSYSVFSASWDENTPGSWLGWNEFVVNFRRMTQAWRSSR